MACGGNSKFFVFGFLFMLLSLILDIVGVAAPYWIYGEKGSGKVYLGLWKICVSGDISGYNISGCSEFEDVPDWFKAVRGFGLLGILISAIGLISALLKTCLKDRVSVLIIAIIMSFISAVCTVVSIAVFAEKHYDLVKDSSFVNFSFAFAFCAVSIVLSAIAGICMIIEIAKRSSYTTIDGR
ncbi:epithelial membrane protein 1-like [Saccostrea echinata]|uniref:epithelial membrane protein 1-like n=1 Tax=Saccostrea echinata TaxID=191078 RepID=UPI002A811350|nr:epithelial membrane protein 1-like [Saccostrea echinata]